MKKQHLIIGIGMTTCLAVSSFILLKNHSSSRNLNDEALLSIIKNDQKGFEKFLSGGGRLDTHLSVEGKNYMVGELIVKYERLGFIKYAQSKKLHFSVDMKKEFDVHSLAVSQNNPEILSLLLNSKPDLNAKLYGKEKWSLLHMASAQCSYKVINILHQAGMNWDLKAQDGSTPLTVAAKEGCLQALSYWKEQGADFKLKDGRGISALSLLNKKKDAALAAFAESFIGRKAASVAVAPVVRKVPNFYNKRKIPKDSLADRAHLIEPEDRPEEANETAAYSEFSD